MPSAAATAPAPSVIQRIEREVPGSVWVALGVALFLAAVAALAAWRTGLLARRRAKEFAEVALVDPLTGVLNRRGFTEAVERELDRARRHEHSFALAFVDVRGLKTVNDTEGHLAGDELLRETASLLRESARAHDFVGRLGGDEMGLLLVEQSADSPAVVVSRIRALVTLRRATSPLHSDWDLTIGTAMYPQDGETFEDLLGAADRRLYQQRGIAIR
jgi:diguanylate cyclase (GGDEF)-like protein